MLCQVTTSLFAKTSVDNYTAYFGGGAYDGSITGGYGAASAVTNASCILFTLWSPSETSAALADYTITLMDVRAIGNTDLNYTQWASVAVDSCTGNLSLCHAAHISVGMQRRIARA